MRNLIADLRYALRGLVQRPGFSALVILTMLLGIGANVAMFAYLTYFLWPTLEAPRPDRLAWIYHRTAESDSEHLRYLDLVEMEPQLRSLFDQLGAFRLFGTSVRTPERTLYSWGTGVAGDYFSLFGSHAEIGRLLTPDDNLKDAPPAVVLQHGFWKRHFSGDPAVIGRQVHLEGRLGATIVGVTPAGFQGTGIATGIYVPMAHAETMIPGRAGANFSALPLGRLKDGVTPSQVTALLANLASGLDEAHPLEQPRDFYSERVTEAEQWDSEDTFVTSAVVLTVAVALLLLLACANVANLMLARATARRREMAVHSALGADRWRLGRRLLMESLVLALIGGGLGLLVARQGLEVIEAYLIHSNPVGMGEWGMDSSIIINPRQVTWFFALVTVGAGLLFGMAPVFQLWRDDLVAALKDDEASAGGQRRLSGRQLLVVAQVALSVVLLTGAGLMARTLMAASQQDLGFKTDHRTVVTVYRSRKQSGENVEVKAMYRDLEARTRELPGVRRASLAYKIPASYAPVDEFEIVASGEKRRVSYNTVASGYFETLGVALLQGRDIKPEDRLGTPGVVVVNQQAAEVLWPGQSPIGELVRLDAGREDERGTYEVVGVVADSRWGRLTEPIRGHFYFPYEQRFRPRMNMIIHASGPIVGPLSELLHQRFPELAILDLQPLSEQVKRSVADQRMNADFASAFGVLGLLLAALGIFSVTSYTTSRRTREIGIRMALGAGRGSVARLVLGETGRLVVVGLVVGVVAAVMLARLLRGVLYGVEAHDPMTFIGVTSALALVGLLSAVPLARRASRIHPVTALRSS